MFFVSKAAKCNELAQVFAHKVQEMGKEYPLDEDAFFGESDAAIERGIPAHIKQDLLESGEKGETRTELHSTLSLLYYFQALLREKDVCPVVSEHLIYTIIETHAFLLSKKGDGGEDGEHWLPPYADQCCFTSTPSCPPSAIALDSPGEAGADENTEAGWSVAEHAVCVQWWQSDSVAEDLTTEPFIDLVCLVGAIADEDTADADAAPVLTQLRLDATAVREMQQRAADLRYSVERQVEDEHSDDDLQRRFGEFINDAIALLNPNLENEEGGATKVEMARKVLQLAPPRQTEQPEGKKGKKKGKEKDDAQQAAGPKPTSPSMEQFGHMFDTNVGLGIREPSLCKWLRLVLPR